MHRNISSWLLSGVGSQTIMGIGLHDIFTILNPTFKKLDVY